MEQLTNFLNSVKTFELSSFLQTESEEELSISDQTIEKIQSAIPKILRLKADPDIEVFPSCGTNIVFRFCSEPNLVFKMIKPGSGKVCNKKLFSENEAIDERLKKTKLARRICQIYKLSLLVIPRTKKIVMNVNRNKYSLIAEECVSELEPSMQERLYQIYSKDLDQAIQQLAIFIIKTGFSDVVWPNMLIVDAGPHFEGPRRIALNDLEEMESTFTGIFGNSDRRGLMKCVSADQMDKVLMIAQENGIICPQEILEKLRNERLRELESDERLYKFYEENTILDGHEPIEVDFDALDLDLTQTAELRYFGSKTLMLDEVVKIVVSDINKKIQENPSKASLKRKRLILLSQTEYGPWSSLGLPKDSKGEDRDSWLRTNSWMDLIIQALKKNRYIFSIKAETPRGVYLQA